MTKQSKYIKKRHVILPELALETAVTRGELDFGGNGAVCSEGLFFVVKELMAHLHL